MTPENTRFLEDYEDDELDEIEPISSSERHDDDDEWELIFQELNNWYDNLHELETDF